MQKAFVNNSEAVFDLIMHRFIDQTLIYGKFTSRLMNKKQNKETTGKTLISCHTALLYVNLEDCEIRNALNKMNFNCR